jgi:ATP-dependent protease ClpP protease subunit
MSKKRRRSRQDENRKKKRKRSHDNDSESSDDDDEQQNDEHDDEDHRWHDVTRLDDYTIFFCGEISRKNVVTFGKILHRMARKLQGRAWRQGKYYSEDVITIKLISDGGECEVGLMAADLIRHCNVYISVEICGTIASAATLLAVGATHKCVMNRHATLLVHQLSSGVMGKLDEINDYAESCSKLDEQMKKLYLSRCPQLKERKLTWLMKREKVLNAEEALKFGFISGII